VVGLLQAAPASLAAAILRGGGAQQWIWRMDPMAFPSERPNAILRSVRNATQQHAVDFLAADQA
jgi:hypothetical protein